MKEQLKQMELLNAKLDVMINLQERNRKNTSNLVWWFAGIPLAILVCLLGVVVAGALA